VLALHGAPAVVHTDPGRLGWCGNQLRILIRVILILAGPGNTRRRSCSDVSREALQRVACSSARSGFRRGVWAVAASALLLYDVSELVNQETGAE
jgi:hypothetical protein